MLSVLGNGTVACMDVFICVRVCGRQVEVWDYNDPPKV